MLFINILQKETRLKRQHRGGSGLFFEALQLKNATKIGMIEKTQSHLPGTLTINR